MMNTKEIHKRAFAKAYLIYVLLALLFVTTVSHSQSISKATFSNGGGDMANADTSISFTLAEPIVGTVSNGNSISQGFWAGVSDGETLTVENTTALSLDITAYPNPVKNELTILSDSEEGYQLIVYDLLGKQVYADKHLGGTLQKTLDLSRLPAGMYHIKLLSHSQHLKTIKILKE